MIWSAMKAKQRSELPARNGGRVLLSSVFGRIVKTMNTAAVPSTQWSFFTIKSRANKVLFSLRVFHPSLGIRLIQANISAACTVLDFPTLEIFETRDHGPWLRHHRHLIHCGNVGKVKKMCEVARALSPRSRIVVGGHVAAIPGLEAMVDADHVVKGEGVEWMRRFLARTRKRPFAILRSVSSFGFRFMGLPLPARAQPCPRSSRLRWAVPWAAISAAPPPFFGGKGKVHNFFKDGNELFDALCDIESQLHSSAFFLLDENFLLHRESRDAVAQSNARTERVVGAYVFSSANAIAQYSIETLVELGVSWIWLGLESPGRITRSSKTPTR